VVKVNDAVTLLVTISGHGKIGNAKILLPEFPSDLEVFDPKESVTQSLDEQGIRVEKKIEQLLIPRSAGQFKIPAISMKVFNPSLKRFQKIKTKPLVIKVRRGAVTAINYNSSRQHTVQAEQQEIDYINHHLGDDYRIKSQGLLVGIFLVNCLLIAGMILWRPFRWFLRIMTGFKRSDRLFISKIRKLKQTPEKLYQQSYQILIEYIARRLKMKPGQINWEIIHNVLGNDEAALNVIQQLKEYESYRYATIDLSKRHIEEDYKRLLSIHQYLRKGIRRK